jgi:hypothetical protein
MKRKTEKMVKMFEKLVLGGDSKTDVGPQNRRNQ